MTAFLRLTLHLVFHLLRPLERATFDRRAEFGLSFKVEKDCHDVDNELISLILLLTAYFERISWGTVDDLVFKEVDQKRPELLRRTFLQVDARSCLELWEYHFANATQDCLHAAVTVEAPLFKRHLVTLSFKFNQAEILAPLAKLWNLTYERRTSHLPPVNAAIEEVTGSFPFASLTGEDLLVHRCW